MSKSILFLLTLAALVAIVLPTRGRTEQPASPILVELFTSEGCSSCPPADRLLRALEAEKTKGADIIVMSEHVDYWDYLGWRDPFSSAQFSKRQQEYSRVLGDNGVYTPQMVVNGRTGFVGNDGRLAFKEITKAMGRPSATIRIGPIAVEPGDGGKSVATVQLAVGDLPQTSAKDELEVMVAVTETGLRSKPRTGENSGASLEHTGVVRTLVKAGRVDVTGFASTARVALNPAWRRESLRVVAFVQERKSRIVWGAAQAPLAPAAP